jgi:hypothetical protein
MRSRRLQVRPPSRTTRSRNWASDQKSPWRTCRSRKHLSLWTTVPLLSTGQRARGHCPSRFYGPALCGWRCSNSYAAIRKQKETHPPASGTLIMPRIIHAAPNGDLFVADSQAGSTLVVRDAEFCMKYPTLTRPAIPTTPSSIHETPSLRRASLI